MTVTIYACMEQPILLESNQNHATITQDGICTTLSASMGLGGGYIPMIVQEVSDEQRNKSNSIFCVPRNKENGSFDNGSKSTS